MGWCMVYPLLLARDVGKKVVKRKSAQSGALDEKIGVALKNLLTVMLNLSQDGFSGVRIEGILFRHRYFLTIRSRMTIWDEAIMEISRQKRAIKD